MALITSVSVFVLRSFFYLCVFWVFWATSSAPCSGFPIHLMSARTAVGSDLSLFLNRSTTSEDADAGEEPSNDEGV